MRVTLTRRANTSTHIEQFRPPDRGQTAGVAEKTNTKGNNMTGSIHIGLAAIGSAIGVGIIGMKAAEATGRNPGAAGAIRNQAIIFAALAEGVVFFAIFLGKMGM
jgi:F-type H+-transporting ATPase subunit c